MQKLHKQQQKNKDLDSRRNASRALGLVLRNNMTLPQSLMEQDSFRRMTKEDQAFAHMLLLTTLRRLGQIDDLIDSLLMTPLPKKQSNVRDILRLGATQIVFLNTPNYAAVNSAVNQVAMSKSHALKGLVNALLRNVSRKSEEIIRSQDPAYLNTSKWLWVRWNDLYGEKIARQLCHAHVLEPPLDITLKNNSFDVRKIPNSKQIMPNTLRIVAAGSVHLLPGYESGEWWVQDIAASLPVKLFGSIKGKNIIEIGAAPGGKTAQLACAGAHVQALDRSPTRLKQLKENLHRLNLQAEIIEDDAETWRPHSLADGVLIDAPCSATGTIRRHPEIIWQHSASDLTVLQEKQLNLLNAALEMVKTSGLIIYTVCSLDKDEGCRVVNKFLKKHKNVKKIPIKETELIGLPNLTSKSGDLRTMPYHLKEMGGMDGFYAVRLQRTF